MTTLKQFNRPFLLTKYIALFAAIAFCAIMAMSSCNSERRFCNFYLKHEDRAAHHCGVWFPPLTRYVSDTTHDTLNIQGETYYVNCDSAIKHDTEHIHHFIPVQCPPSKVITNTIRDTAYVENTAKVKYLTSQVDSLKQQTGLLQIRKDTWIGRALWGWGIVAVLLLIWAALSFAKRISVVNGLKP